MNVIVKKFSPTEQVALYRRMRKGDAEARRLLIECIIPWAIERAKKAVRQAGPTQDELIAACFLGCIQAVDTWRPKKGALTTWAAMKFLGQISSEFNRSVGFKCFRGMTSISPENEPSFDPDIPGRFERDEACRELRREIARLPHRERRVVESRLYGGRLQDAGKRIGVGRITARKLEQQAHYRMKLGLILAGVVS